ncbi:zinc-ribbon domain-containing protein [Nostoc sp.]
MINFCPYCNHQYPLGNKLCSACGKAIPLMMSL